MEILKVILCNFFLHNASNTFDENGLSITLQIKYVVCIFYSYIQVFYRFTCFDSCFYFVLKLLGQKFEVRVINVFYLHKYFTVLICIYNILRFILLFVWVSYKIVFKTDMLSETISTIH